jgi:hypothetical protein
MGCFGGLSEPEQTVLNMRAGFAGQLPQTRRQVARRIGTSPRQIRLTEQRAVQRLNGLAQTEGCAGTTEFVGSVTVVNGIIGPAEIAIDRRLVAFGNPGYQGYEQSSFGSLGQAPAFKSPGPLPASFGSGTGSTSGWAIQLLAVMLLAGLIGFRRVVPHAAARLRRPIPAREASVEALDHSHEAPPARAPAVERRREQIAA